MFSIWRRGTHDCDAVCGEYNAACYQICITTWDDGKYSKFQCILAPYYSFIVYLADYCSFL